MRILQGAPAREAGATVAQVTFSEPGSFGAVSATEQRDLPVFAPRGVAYRPCEGDNLLLLQAGGATVCGGVLCSADGLEPGELRLVSSGGAWIHLQNTGNVVINGVTFTRDGRILPPDSGEV